MPHIGHTEELILQITNLKLKEAILQEQNLEKIFCLED